MKKDSILLYLQYISLLDFKTKEYKVFLYILNQLRFNKYKIINQKLLCEELGLSKSEVSKGIKKLIDKKVLVLNPDSVYKNKKKELKLNEYSNEELEDMIFELVEQNYTED